MKIVARATYEDRGDSATFEFRIEEREGSYALIHGLAERSDMQTEEFFVLESEMRSASRGLWATLPEPHADTPASNFTVESLLEQWRAATLPALENQPGS